MNKNIRNYIKLILVLILISTFYIVFGCPIKYLTGISCPGCGMTRAWLSVISLNFDRAFYYHPLWIIPLLYVFDYFFIRKINNKLYNIIFYIFIALFLITYLFRLFSTNEIVSIELEKGLIYRIFVH